MVTHATELLTAGSDQADILLREERDNLGGISIEELHRLIYAQVLSSHSLTWQVSISYFKILLNIVLLCFYILTYWLVILQLS